MNKTTLPRSTDFPKKIRDYSFGPGSRPAVWQYFVPGGAGWSDVDPATAVYATTAEIVRLVETRGATMFAISESIEGAGRIADFSARELLDSEAPTVTRHGGSRNGRPALTPHQKDVFGDLRRRYAAAKRPIADSEIGSRGALGHLVAKGYAVEITTRGPRGGYHYSYEPIV